MKVSVIIPAHNEEERIATAVKALLAQDYPDFEVIVVDDASIDKTAEVAGRFPVKVVHESRKGTMWACERGRQEAHGDIIVRMDADCNPDPHWLSRGVHILRNDPKVAVVSGPYDFADGSPMFRLSSAITQKTIYPMTNYLLRHTHRGGITVGGNTFIRASVLDQAGGFNTAIQFYGDDTDLPKRLSKYGKIVFSTDVVMPTSARRFREEGFMKLTLIYWWHFFRTVLVSDRRVL